jgi:hypothetical protein
MTFTKNIKTNLPEVDRTIFKKSESEKARLKTLKTQFKATGTKANKIINL